MIYPNPGGFGALSPLHFMPKVRPSSSPEIIKKLNNHNDNNKQWFLSTYYTLSILLSPSHECSHLILTRKLWNRHYYYHAPFSHEEI